MNKVFLAGAAIGLLAIAAAITLWHINSHEEEEPENLPPYDYADTASWHVKPAAPPPPVWQDGWATDVLLLASQTRRQPEDYAEALAAAGPVYAPRLRRADFADDAAAALTHYVERANQGRAFIIATSEPLPASLVPVINSDPMLRARFGGVLLLNGQTEAFGAGVHAGAVCSDRFKPSEACAETIDIRRESGSWVIAGEDPLEGPVLGGFKDWLEDSAPKLAPPLGDFEDIEVVEIRRPGQTD
ncbi:hypothetical protein [Hyphomonas sp.]|uniref:hypothetical protein n=1 Tax=Hyphomonas sp. TaxID=87 RepID=UPI00391CF27A